MSFIELKTLWPKETPKSIPSSAGCGCGAAGWALGFLPQAEPKGQCLGSCQHPDEVWILTGIRDRLQLGTWFICCWRLPGHTHAHQTASTASLPKLHLHGRNLLVNLHTARGLSSASPSSYPISAQFLLRSSCNPQIQFSWT